MEKKEVFCRIRIVGENVHEVGYLPFLMRIARRLSIPKFDAENFEEASQRIEVLAGGNEDSISEFVRTIKERQPADARVMSITSNPEREKHVMLIDEYDRLLSAELWDKLICAWAAYARKA
jgi:acylphosphatase